MMAEAGDEPSEFELLLAREIDLICRRFEAAWGEGTLPQVGDYLEEIREDARPALRAELEALARELSGSRSTVAEALTIVPGGSEIHEQATVAPGDLATVGPPATEPAGAGPVVHDRLKYFGDYEIVRELARGGMGVVFLARQVSLNRRVAIKMILAGQLAGDVEVRRFYTEAEAAANLDHPGIVPIYEVGEHDGQHYFSMGFVEGQSLSQRLAEGPLTAGEAAGLMIKVAEAIAYAHERGVIHRDLKPANILLDMNGNPRVTDFGLAKKWKEDSGLTGSGQIMGTPSYMPPEQAGGDRGDVGPGADVYSLGATLYALLTGRPPFQAASAMDTVLMVVGEEPVSPRRLNGSIPLDLETICMKCLEKEPGKRYGSAGMLANDLRRFVAGEPISARPVSSAERLWRWCKRNRAVAVLSGCVAASLLIGAMVATFFAIRANRNAEVAEQNRQLADNEAKRANLEADRVQQAKRESDRQLYVARMNLAQQAWRDGNVSILRQYLDSPIAIPAGETDPRGFEWHYLRRLLELELRTIQGHGGQVQGVAFRPDGRLLTTASSDGTAKTWEVATGKEVGSLPAFTAYGVAYSPDGKTLAVVTGGVGLYDLVTGGKPRMLVGHVGNWGVTDVAFSPNGKTLATASGDNTAILWDVATGKPLHTLRLDMVSVTAVAFSPDGLTLATNHDNGKIVLWEVTTGRALRIILGTGSVRRMQFSPDGRTLAAGGSDFSVRTWELSTGKVTGVFRGHSGKIAAVRYSPDGRTIASGAADGTVRLWEAATGQERLVLRGHRLGVNDVAFAPDGRMLASASDDQTIKLWDLAATGESLAVLAHPRGVHSVAYGPDGTRVASAGADRTAQILYAFEQRDPDMVKLWDAVTGRELRALGGNYRDAQVVAFSPDGKLVAFAGHGMDLWEAATGRTVLTITDGTFNPVTKEIPILVQKGKPRGPYTLAPVLKGMAFAPDGRHVASADSNNAVVRICDIEAGTDTPLAKNMGWISSVAYSPDGKRLAFGGYSGLSVWSFEDRTYRVIEKDPEVLCIAYSPDGRVLASARDSLIQLWDIATWTKTVSLRGHAGPVRGVVFSPDGRRVVSGGDDATVRVWDAVSGQALLTLTGHSGGVSSVAFSPDGQIILSGSADGTIRYWSAAAWTEDARVLREARSVVDFFMGQNRDDAFVRSRIKVDPTIGEVVRRRAVELYEAGLVVKP